MSASIRSALERIANMECTCPAILGGPACPHLEARTALDAPAAGPSRRTAREILDGPAGCVEAGSSLGCGYHDALVTLAEAETS